jgi:hypothetical protein
LKKAEAEILKLEIPTPLQFSSVRVTKEKKELDAHALQK